MTATYAADDTPAPSPITRLWQRQLNHYPNNGPRFLSLGIIVATTVVLYYQLYLSGAVAIDILGNLHMSFLYYVNIAVIGYVFGAVASVVAGLADRYGRANIVTAGLALTGVLSLFVLPNMHSKLGFGIAFVAIGFVEGIVLVATPALIRDFSPQLGRASAMGFWTLGPVLGSLVVSAIVTNTASHDWQWQYRLAGIVGVVVFIIALLGLRELAPNLRDQLMVSQKDRVLIEARAKGLDIEDTLKKPFRQMLKLDIVGSAFAISVFLTIYFIAVGFFPLFFETVFGYSASKANGLGNYFWAFDALALLVVGILSDLVRVRKPFMILGAVSAIVFTTIFTLDATKSGTTHGTFIVLLIGMSASLGVAFAPWMASFTETVERRNPALTATGLAIWGLIIRIVVALVAVIAPHIVTAVTPLTVVGTIEASKVPITTAAGPTTVGKVVTAVAGNSALVGQVTTDATQYKSQLATLGKLDKATAATLATDPTSIPAGIKALSEVSGVSLADTTTVATLEATKPGALAAAAVIDTTTATTLLTSPTNAAAQATAIGEIVKGLGVSEATAVADLTQLGTIPVADLLTVKANAAALTAGTAALKSASTVPASVLTLLTATAPQQLGVANFAALSAVGTPAGNPSLTAALGTIQAKGPAIAAAQKNGPRQWQHYFWYGVGGQVLFIPLVFLMAGFWSPRKAKRAEQEHEAMVAAEMAKLQSA
jgi:MFS family permease